MLCICIQFINIIYRCVYAKLHIKIYIYIRIYTYIYTYIRIYTYIKNYNIVKLNVIKYKLILKQFINNELHIFIK